MFRYRKNISYFLSFFRYFNSKYILVFFFKFFCLLFFFSNEFTNAERCHNKLRHLDYIAHTLWPHYNCVIKLFKTKNKAYIITYCIQNIKKKKTKKPNPKKKNELTYTVPNICTYTYKYILVEHEHLYINIPIKQI